ncbi:hypothetical protein [Conexibacter woesei]|uniref:hypothetical protein n=1 Tax=Conexibacter woesei TaxID=191495 RepID=UPI0004141F6F|nr:hypothetical protein [Conexibacter woesei]
MKRPAVTAVLALRAVYGVALIAAPERLARRWLGPSAATGPTQVPLRALGMRELLIHGGALVAIATSDADPKPFLYASIAGDLSDIAATFAARRELPGDAVPATALVAGASAALSAVVARTA